MLIEYKCASGLTLLFIRTVRHDFFHEFEFILIFPSCPQPFSSGAMQNWQLGKTAPRDKLIPNPKARLREQVREVMRFHHYSLRTEEAYGQWIKRFIFFHGKRHPRELATGEVSAFLSHLTTADDAARATPAAGAECTGLPVCPGAVTALGHSLLVP